LQVGTLAWGTLAAGERNERVASGHGGRQGHVGNGGKASGRQAGGEQVHWPEAGKRTVASERVDMGGQANRRRAGTLSVGGRNKRVADWHIGMGHIGKGGRNERVANGTLA
jgi:hypothetical protein